MKRICFLLLVLGGVLLQNFSLSAHEAGCEKIYISPDKLLIHQKGIFHPNGRSMVPDTANPA
jgi:hypothetical protein